MPRDTATESITVHIGRVEVRATLTPPPASRPAQPTSPRTLTLKDYLGRRDRQRR
jgi:hypothetical protein